MCAWLSKIVTLHQRNLLDRFEVIWYLPLKLSYVHVHAYYIHNIYYVMWQPQDERSHFQLFWPHLHPHSPATPKMSSTLSETRRLLPRDNYNYARGIPRIERGGVRVAIGGMIRRLGSVVIHSTFGVRMRALYQGGCTRYERPMLGTPLYATRSAWKNPTFCRFYHFADSINWDFTIFSIYIIIVWIKSLLSMSIYNYYCTISELYIQHFLTQPLLLFYQY